MTLPQESHLDRPQTNCSPRRSLWPTTPAKDPRNSPAIPEKSHTVHGDAGPDFPANTPLLFPRTRITDSARIPAGLNSTTTLYLPGLGGTHDAANPRFPPCLSLTDVSLHPPGLCGGTQRHTTSPEESSTHAENGGPLSRRTVPASARTRARTGTRSPRTCTPRGCSRDSTSGAPADAACVARTSQTARSTPLKA